MKKKLISHFLEIKEFVNLVKIFEKSSIELRLVGGCIRDILLKKGVKDIDIAIKCEPEVFVEILNKNNVIFNDYAIKYGSVVATINNKNFHITSLRKDFDQSGRYTKVKYTNNWEIDAKRRDFTINSIYLSIDNNLYDYFNGVEDLNNNVVRFIEDIRKSIKQDLLRIFRYYRFLGCFKKPVIINDYEKILHVNLIEALEKLSNDKIKSEILKMFNNFYPMNSFIDNNNNIERNKWVIEIHKIWLDQKYEHGINKCIEKIDSFFIK